MRARGAGLELLLMGTKGLAEGRFGSRLQKVWQVAEGWKTYFGFGVGFVGYLLDAGYAAGICEQCSSWGETLLVIGAIGAQIGLLDAANRAQGPLPLPIRKL